MRTIQRLPIKITAAAKRSTNLSLIMKDQSPSGLNGFILLMHIGTDPKRTDKFYRKLPGLINYLRSKGYQFQINRGNVATIKT